MQGIVDAVPHELQPVPDTVALLRRLRDAGREIYFLSNMPAPYADHLQARHDFVGWFHDGGFSAPVHANKPEAVIFEIAAIRFGAAPGELVFLDDHLPNVLAARALGWNALQFSNAAQAEAELRERGWARKGLAVHRQGGGASLRTFAGTHDRTLRGGESASACDDAGADLSIATARPGRQV